MMIAGLAMALLVAAATDWRSRTISNWLNLGIAVAAPIFWWSTGLDLWPNMAIQLGFGFAVTAFFAIFFALGAMGGGDVKLLGALALWIPPLPFVSMLITMSILGGVLTVFMLVRHKMIKATGQLEIPYGVAIAAAGIWSIYERYFNHFG